MKRSSLWPLLGLLILGCSREVAFPPTASAQLDGCSLTSWIMQQQPHSTRTPELAFNLRDTQLNVNGTNHKISIPKGFTMTSFAKVASARGLTLSPDGVVYATSYANGGQVFALPDHNNDGVADSVILVATGLGNPHGIGFHNGELYVSNDNTLYHLIDQDHDRIAESRLSVASLPPSGGHSTRNFVFDEAKQKIYVQVGSEGNTDTTDLANRALILEFNMDGSGRRVYARGLRNAVGMDLDPRTDALWVNNNGMDQLFGSGDPRTNDNPSECIYLVCDGAHYGWPWVYGFQMRNPMSGWNSLSADVLKTFSGPVAEVLAHSAPLGLHFYRGASFPQNYHHAIFQCYHGSWNRSPAAPPRVTVMWADSKGQNAHVTDFVNGFQPDSSGGRWGRVVSVIEGTHGELYVSDDQAGLVYRIVYTGSNPPSLEIDNSNLAGRIYPPGSHIAVNWTMNTEDAIDVAFSSDGVTWSTTGVGVRAPFDFLLPHITTQSARLKVTDRAAGLESISAPFRIQDAAVEADTAHPGLEVSSITPNPNHGIAKLTFRLGLPSRVKIEIVDVLGREVRLAADSDFPIGDETIALDLQDLLPAGYFVRMSAGQETITRKILVQ